MKPIVSIILTSYNKPWFIAKTIESIIQQTWTAWELFIMDDHSTEETEKVIKRYLNDPRIHYQNSFIKDEDRYKTTRYATLINEAIPLTTGKYITYITDDTIYLPERLEEMVHFMEANPAFHIIYSGQLVKIVDQSMTSLREFKREANENLLKAADIVDHCSVMHTKEIAEKVKKQYGSYWDDDPRYWCRGDAAFWERLNVFQPFYPLNKILDITYKTPSSVQTLFQQLPRNLPNGILVTGTNGKVYLIDSEKRRLISAMMMEYYKYNKGMITKIPDPLLYTLEEGEAINHQSTLPNYRLIRDQDGIVYYIENNKKRRLVSSSVLRKYRFNTKEIIDIDSKKVQIMQSGPDLYTNASREFPLPEGKLYKSQNQFWIMKDKTIYSIEKDVLLRLNLFQNYIDVSSTLIKQFNIGDTSIYDALNK